MKIIRNSNENEMILDFLKGEIESTRFNNELLNTLKELKIDKNIIINGDLNNKNDNKIRLEIMKLYRGYPNKELFENFPKIYKWEYCKLSQHDINHIYYIDYDYWNLLSNNTSSPIEAVKNIKNGIEIFDVPNKPFLDGVKYAEKNTFPPLVLITCNSEKYLIIEGHSRMTIYAFNPKKLNDSYAYVGYCSEDDMKKYDIRMLSGESLNSRKY